MKKAFDLNDYFSKESLMLTRDFIIAYELRCKTLK